MCNQVCHNFKIEKSRGGLKRSREEGEEEEGGKYDTNPNAKTLVEHKGIFYGFL